MVLGATPVLGDPLQVDALVNGQVSAFGELLLGEQAGLDPLGQLDLLPGVEQRDLPDLPEVVLNRVGTSAGGCHPGGGKVLVVIAGNQRLVLALLARRLRQGARRSPRRAPARAPPPPARRPPRSTRPPPRRA